MSSEQEISKILDANTRALAENSRLLRKFRRQLVINQVLAWLRILIIVIPLILAYFYLRPYYKDTMKMYRDVLGGTSNAGRLNILEQLRGIAGQKE